MNTLVQDLRYAFRTLVRGRSFTAVAILTLAIALGANTAIFTLVNAILIDPLPFGDPDRIVKINNRNLRTGSTFGQHSYPNIVDFGKNVKSIEMIAAYSTSGMFLMEGDEPELVTGTDIEAAGMRIFGVKPVVG